MQTAVLQSLTRGCLPACPPPPSPSSIPKGNQALQLQSQSRLCLQSEALSFLSCLRLAPLYYFSSSSLQIFIEHSEQDYAFFPHPIGPHMSFPMSHEPSMILFWFGLTALNTAEIVCVYLLISSLPYWNISSVKARTFSPLLTTKFQTSNKVVNTY